MIMIGLQVVSVSTFELLFMIFTGDGTSSGLSTLRLVRVLRVVRVMGIFQNLNLLVTAFLRFVTKPIAPFVCCQPDISYPMCWFDMF